MQNQKSIIMSNNIEMKYYYPFGEIQFANSSSLVKYPRRFNHNQIDALMYKINLHLSLKNPNLIKIIKIFQQTPKLCFDIYFEYVHYNIRNFFNTLTSNQICSARNDLISICNQLIDCNIYPQISECNIGFDNNKNIKLFVPIDFNQLNHLDKKELMRIKQAEIIRLLNQCIITTTQFNRLQSHSKSFLKQSKSQQNSRIIINFNYKSPQNQNRQRNYSTLIPSNQQRNFLPFHKVVNPVSTQIIQSNTNQKNMNILKNPVKYFVSNGQQGTTNKIIPNTSNRIANFQPQNNIIQFNNNLRNNTNNHTFQRRFVKKNTQLVNQTLNNTSIINNQSAMASMSYDQINYSQDYKLINKNNLSYLNNRNVVESNEEPYIKTNQILPILQSQYIQQRQTIQQNKTEEETFHQKDNSKLTENSKYKQLKSVQSVQGKMKKQNQVPKKNEQFQKKQFRQQDKQDKSKPKQKSATKQKNKPLDKNKKITKHSNSKDIKKSPKKQQSSNMIKKQINKQQQKILQKNKNKLKSPNNQSLQKKKGIPNDQIKVMKNQTRQNQHNNLQGNKQKKQKKIKGQEKKVVKQQAQFKDHQSIDTYHQQLGQIIQMPKIQFGPGLRQTASPTQLKNEREKNVKLHESVGFGGVNYIQQKNKQQETSNSKQQELTAEKNYHKNIKINTQQEVIKTKSKIETKNELPQQKSRDILYKMNYGNQENYYNNNTNKNKAINFFPINETEKQEQQLKEQPNHHIVKQFNNLFQSSNNVGQNHNNIEKGRSPRSNQINQRVRIALQKSEATLEFFNKFKKNINLE